jgi:hypothetical protein
MGLICHLLYVDGQKPKKKNLPGGAGYLLKSS